MSFEAVLAMNAGIHNPVEAKGRVRTFQVGQQVVQQELDKYLDQEFITCRAWYHYWVHQFISIGQDDEPSTKTWRYKALVRDGTQDFWEFIASKTGPSSATTIGILGPTESGKSGTAQTIAKSLGNTRQQIEESTFFDVRPCVTAVDGNIEANHRGEPYCKALIMDESNANVGEGSRTSAEVLRNKRGRAREGGVTIIAIRPNDEVMDDSDITLVCIGYSMKHRKYAAMCFLRKAPVGVVFFDFPEPEWWGIYHPLKIAALTRRGTGEAYNATREFIEIVMDPDKMERIITMKASSVAIRQVGYDGMVAGISTQTWTHLAKMVEQAAKLYDTKDDFNHYLKAVWPYEDAPGLTPHAAKKWGEIW